MKRKLAYTVGNKRVEREYSYIPARYILAAFITIFEILAILAVVVLLCYIVPYFYLAALVTQICCVVRIISSDDNPDYKIPWLLFVLILPIAGFMLYLLFYSRKLKPKYLRRMNELKTRGYSQEDGAALTRLRAKNERAYLQASMLRQLADARLFEGTKTTYFPLGEKAWTSLLADLKTAERFIYVEYFIIEQGAFWNSVLALLTEKAKQGVEIKVLYDDIGCMTTLPGNYAKQLKKSGIEGAPFARLKGAADGEFNNRNHRKILVIDGRIGYTGGVNIADEYVNLKPRFGHWKDSAIRLEGEAVRELTRLFLIDFGMSVRKPPTPREDYYPALPASDDGGYCIPFGDGPRPLYRRRVAQSLLCDMIAGAKKFVYITTPYLIIDNALCQTIESAALKGVSVKLITPRIPDKKLVFGLTRSFYPRLLAAGVEVYEYEAGFIHAKNYLVDGEIGVIGTVNLDYRSLVHHFENGVWLYESSCLRAMQEDIESTLSRCIRITEKNVKPNLFARAFRSVARIFAPLM